MVSRTSALPFDALRGLTVEEDYRVSWLFFTYCVDTICLLARCWWAPGCEERDSGHHSASSGTPRTVVFRPAPLWPPSVWSSWNREDVAS